MQGNYENILKNFMTSQNYGQEQAAKLAKRSEEKGAFYDNVQNIEPEYVIKLAVDDELRDDIVKAVKDSVKSSILKFMFDVKQQNSDGIPPQMSLSEIQGQ